MSTSHPLVTMIHHLSLAEPEREPMWPRHWAEPEDDRTQVRTHSETAASTGRAQTQPVLQFLHQ